MTLDTALVCSACRRFWHGPPGQLPFPSPRGVYCEDARHAKPRPDQNRIKTGSTLELEGEVRAWLSTDDLNAALRNAIAAEARGLPHSRGPDATPEAEVERRTNAFRAEAAVARFTGENWNNRDGEAGGPDVGADIDAKWRPGRDWDLIIRPEDHKNRRFVLVRGYWPDDLWLAGWIFGHEAPALAVAPDWVPRNSRDLTIPGRNLRPIRTLETPAQSQSTRGLDGRDEE